MMVHAEMGYIEGESRYHSSDPQQEPYSHGDLYTSLECLSAILAALYQREHTGKANTSMCRWPRRCCASTNMARRT